MTTAPATDEEVEAHKVRMIEANMRADGEATHVKVQQDYFGFAASHRVLFPDGLTYVEHEEMNEGARRSFLNKSNRGMTIRKATGDADIKVRPGDDRHDLLVAAITGWNLIKDGQPWAFSIERLEGFLKVANPRIVDDIEKDIRKKNPWLLQNMTVEDIEKEIGNLNEMLEVAKKNEEGKGS